MIYTITITSQGQLNIPVKAQKELGLKKPAKAIMVIEAGKLIVEPVKDFLELKGSLKTKKRPLSAEELHEAFGKYLAEEAVGKKI